MNEDVIIRANISTDEVKENFVTKRNDKLRVVRVFCAIVGHGY